MAKPQVRRTSEARNDLLEILTRIGRTDPKAATRLSAAIDDKLDLLTRFPYMGESCDEYAPQLRQFPVGNFILFYRPVEKGIELIRAFHGARDIPPLFGQ